MAVEIEAMRVGEFVLVAHCGALLRPHSRSAVARPAICDATIGTHRADDCPRIPAGATSAAFHEPRPRGRQGY